jgi:Tfp pilus assembly protein PilV
MVNGMHVQRRGVVLIDSIVAAVLLGVALAVMIGLGGRAISSQKTGEELQTAAMLVDEQLSLVLARGADDYASRFPTRGQCDSPFERFEYSLEISEGQSGDPYRVVATISWSAGAKVRTESVETLIAPRLGDNPDPIRKPDQAVNRWY